MVFADPARERLAQRRLAATEPLAPERCELLRVGLARNQRFQDAPATGPRNISDDGRQLDVRLLENCLNALNSAVQSRASTACP